MDGFYTSRAFQRYQEHPNRSSDDKVTVLRSWTKNRGLQQSRESGTDVATLQNQSIPTSRRCCTTSRCSGSVLGGFLVHFEPIMEGFKAQSRGIEKEDIFVIDFGAF